MLTESVELHLPLDHVVISAANLRHAVALFESAGFHVEYGGQNGPSHNALIFFEDGKYIELISIRSKLTRTTLRILSIIKSLGLTNNNDNRITARFMGWFDGKTSLRDWCLRCTNIRETVKALQTQGYQMTGIEEFKRLRPDGKLAEWLLAGTTSPSLPFLIEDISATNIRVPFEEASHHKNGVTGISELRINRQHLDISDEQLQLFADTFNNTNSFNSKVSFEKHPNKPQLSVELKSNHKNKGLIASLVKYNIDITIT